MRHLQWIATPFLLRTRKSNSLIYALTYTIRKQGEKVEIPTNPLVPGCRHRAAKDTWDFITGYIICWIGILVYHGSVGSGKYVTNYWRSMPYGIYAPWIQNTMPVNVFERCRRFIHLSVHRILIIE